MSFASLSAAQNLQRTLLSLKKKREFSDRSWNSSLLYLCQFPSLNQIKMQRSSLEGEEEPTALFILMDKNAVQKAMEKQEKNTH